MGSITYRTTRRITRTECPWLDGPIAKGTTLHRYFVATYNVIGPDGVAVTHQPNSTPFFEVPISALERKTAEGEQ